MPFKVTFFSQQQGDLLGGWQFSLFNNGADFPTVKASALAMAPILNLVMGGQAGVQSVRVSLVGAFRAAQPFPSGVTQGGGFNTGPLKSGDSTYISVDVQLKLTAPAGTNGFYTTTSWLRGMRASDFAVAGHYVGGVGTPPMKKFLAALTGSGWCLYVLDKARPKFYFPASSFNGSTGVFTGMIGLGAASKNLKVRIQGTGARNPLNDIWYCTYDGTSVLTINGWSPSPPAIFIPITGKNPFLRPQTYITVAIGPNTLGLVPQGSSLGITSVHKTGRPTGLLGGRPKRKVVFGLPAVV